MQGGVGGGNYATHPVIPSQSLKVLAKLSYLVKPPSDQYRRSHVPPFWKLLLKESTSTA